MVRGRIVVVQKAGEGKEITWVDMESKTCHQN